MLKEKDELRDSNSQFRDLVNDLRSCMCAPKESLNSPSHRADNVENQTQDLILLLAKNEGIE